MDFTTVRISASRLASAGNDWHLAEAVLNPTTTVEDVFFGFYSWLDKHPTEALLISINHESGTGTPNDAKFYEHLYDLFNSSPAAEYWLQTNGTVSYAGLHARKFLTFVAWYSWRGPGKDDAPSTVQQ